jgi:cytidine deaminase
MVEIGLILSQGLRMGINRAELKAELMKLPPAGADRLGGLMGNEVFDGAISAADAAALAAEMDITVGALSLRLVGCARLYAIAPVSGFKVGAIAQGLTGALYYGANLELSGQALSFAVHAEQSATSNAWLHGEAGLATLAVSAAPCGYCRQFLQEVTTASSLQILQPNMAEQSLTSLLPKPFGPEQGGLMAPQDHGLTLSTTPEATAGAALAAANASHAPLSGNYAGVALRMSDGKIFSGRHAENAAFNPSMSPLAAALSVMVFNDYGFDDIAEAVLVEPPGPASQADATKAVLSSVASNVTLTVLHALQATARARKA